MLDEMYVWDNLIGKNVVITDINGKRWAGRITGMEGSNDSENGKYSIDLKEEGKEYLRSVVCFEEDEIASVEIMD